MHQKLISKTRQGGSASGSRPPPGLLEQAAAPTQTPHGMTRAPGQHAARAYMGIAGAMPGRQAAQPLSPKVYGPVNTMHQTHCPYCGHHMGDSALATPFAAL